MEYQKTTGDLFGNKISKKNYKGLKNFTAEWYRNICKWTW